MRVAPENAWFSVMSGSEPVGSGSVVLDTMVPGFRITTGLSYELPQRNRLQRIVSRESLILSSTLSLTRIETVRISPNQLERFELSRDDGRWWFRSSTNPNSHFLPTPELPMSTPLVAAYQLALSRGLREGRSLEPLLYQGWEPRLRVSRIVVGHDSMVSWPDSVKLADGGRNWEIITSMESPGIRLIIDATDSPQHITVAPNGRLLGLETLFGFSWIRSNVDLAGWESRHRDSAATTRVIQSFPLTSELGISHPSLESSEGRRFLITRRDGSAIPSELLALLADSRQSLRGDTLLISPHVSSPARDSLDPGDGASALLLTPRSDTGTKGLALLGISPEQPVSPQDLIRLVHSQIRVDTSASTDGWTALGQRKGHPDGIVRAFLLLAREAGLTARPVSGVLVINDSIFTHPWAELLKADGRWLPVDPVRGKGQASTDLIRLGWGSSTRPDDMLPSISNARITPLPPERNEP